MHAPRHAQRMRARRPFLPVLLLLALMPFVQGSGSGVEVEEGSGDITPAGWRGAPIVLGIDCATTDLVRGAVVPDAVGVRVTVEVRDVRGVCLDENTVQKFGYTFNFFRAGGGEGWAEVTLTRTPTSLYASFRDVTLCEGRVPLGGCDWLGWYWTTVAFDADASTFAFTIPVGWEDISAVWFASEMWDCSSNGSGTVCVDGSFAGPGDRMPDVGERSTTA
jgi:hypothetical protein